jgi:uncharacterized membrane protein YccC
LRAIDAAELQPLEEAAHDFAALRRLAFIRARKVYASCICPSSPATWLRTVFISAQLHTAELRFCLRAMVNALLAFGVTHIMSIPLNGQWVVPTAVAVIQMSIGGSLKAAAEYIVGTIGGALYATGVAAIVPPTTELSFAFALALAIGPLAYAAAIRPSLRVAPVTAVLVLMISTKLGEAPIGLAYDRLLEVGIGLAIAVTVSFLILPAPAHKLGLESAARALELMASGLPSLVAGQGNRLSSVENTLLQDDVGEAVRNFAEVAGEARGERIGNLAPDPDPAALARTLRRLRHDLVMLGRATAEPLPAHVATRLQPLLDQIGATARDYLRANAAALIARGDGPARTWVEWALMVYLAEVAAMRRKAQLSGLSAGERDRIVTRGFALQQLQQNLIQLEHCVTEWARNPGWSGKARDIATQIGLRPAASVVTSR